MGQFKFGRENVKEVGNPLLNHLIEFHTITDEEIERRAGGDVEEHLLMLLERSFVQEMNARIREDLLKWVYEGDNSGQ